MDAGHYNLHGFEKRHYNSQYWIFAITILTNPESCPILRLARIRAHLQALYFRMGVFALAFHRISPPGRLPLASLFSLVLPPDQNSPPPPRSRAPAPASLAAARIPRRCWTATIADEEEPHTAVCIPWRGWRRPDGDVCIFLASLSH